MPDYCQNCDRWRAYGAKIASVMTGRDPAMTDGLGTCHLYPPTPIAIGPGWVESVWPQTRESDVCGEWTPVGWPDPKTQGPDDPDPDDGEPLPVERDNVVAIGRAA